MTEEGLANFGEFLGQITAVEPQPVSVADNFVRIDRGDGVFEVHDGRDGRLQHDVLDTGGICRADRRFPVDQYFDVQAVIDQQDRSRRSASPVYPTNFAGSARLVSTPPQGTPS